VRLRQREKKKEEKFKRKFPKLKKEQRKSCGIQWRTQKNKEMEKKVDIAKKSECPSYFFERVGGGAQRWETHGAGTRNLKASTLPRERTTQQQGSK